MAQEITQFFYNFCFPDSEVGFKNHGFYHISHQAERIYSHTEFDTPEGIYRNIFNLKIKENTVIAYKHNDGTWVDVQENHFPTSAYPLLLPHVGDEPLRYLSIREDTSELMGEAVLLREGNDIVETVQDKVMRRFTMKLAEKVEPEAFQEIPRYTPSYITGYIPRSIDWGGAKSFLCRDEVEAVKGTSFKIDASILQK